MPLRLHAVACNCGYYEKAFIGSLTTKSVEHVARMSHFASQLNTSRTPLARSSQLLSPETGVNIGCWCTVGERVCFWDMNSKSILVYSVC